MALQRKGARVVAVDRSDDSQLSLQELAGQEFPSRMFSKNVRQEWPAAASPSRLSNWPFKNTNSELLFWNRART